MRRMILLPLLMIVIAWQFGCNDSSTPSDSPGPPVVDDPPDTPDYTDTVFITDRTGKKWDITYAVENYGLDSNRFNFGNGPYFFLPYINPQFYEPGDDGYPDDAVVRNVTGTTIDGDSRAYANMDLISHEVVNDKFGDKHVAVTF